MIYVSRKERIRKWALMDAERRKRDEIAARVAEELCPTGLRLSIGAAEIWSAAIAQALNQTSFASRMLAARGAMSPLK